MAKTVKAENLSNEILKALETYSDDIYEIVKEEANSVSKEAVKDLKSSSPKGYRGSYANGWSKQTGKQNKGTYSVKIHNKTDYQLTHLLEFGHATRNGKRTKAQTHIRPVEEKYAKEYQENLTTVIKRRSKK